MEGSDNFLKFTVFQESGNLSNNEIFTMYKIFLTF